MVQDLALTLPLLAPLCAESQWNQRWLHPDSRDWGPVPALHGEQGVRLVDTHWTPCSHKAHLKSGVSTGGAHTHMNPPQGPLQGWADALDTEAGVPVPQVQQVRQVQS